MTVIAVAGDPSEKHCFIGSDSQASQGSSTMPIGSKIHRIGLAIVGSEGSHALQHVIRYHADEVELPGGSLDMWASKHFVPWIRKHFADRSLMELVNGKQQLPGAYIIALRGEFCIVDDQLSVVFPKQSFWAIGSGGPEARGAMHAAKALGFSAPEMVEKGIEAACALDDGCGLPLCALQT